MNACIVVPTGAAIALGSILAAAGIAKLRAPADAARLIARHGSMRATSPRLVALLALLELGAGVALTVPALRTPAVIASALLLLFYSCGVAFALVRGHAGEDCGCGGIAGHVPIGGGLLARNLALAIVAASLAVLPSSSPRGTLEWIASIALAVLGLLLYQAVNFLLSRETLLADD